MRKIVRQATGRRATLSDSPCQRLHRGRLEERLAGTPPRPAHTEAHSHHAPRSTWIELALLSHPIRAVTRATQVSCGAPMRWALGFSTSCSLYAGSHMQIGPRRVFPHAIVLVEHDEGCIAPAQNMRGQYDEVTGLTYSPRLHQGILPAVGNRTQHCQCGALGHLEHTPCMHITCPSCRPRRPFCSIAYT